MPAWRRTGQRGFRSSFHPSRNFKLTPARPAHIIPPIRLMSAKLLLKTIFFIIILLLLVLMGMHNLDTVNFTLPPLLKQVITQPAALMYFAFFALGVLTGTIMTAGTGRKAGGAKNGQK